jgi:drug/metabolite transporter (DMT)-like permease
MTMPAHTARSARLATAELLAGATLISFSPVFVNLADVGPTMAGFYRCLFGGTFLIGIALIRREPLWRGRGPLLLAVVAAGLFAADLSFWHRSIEAIGPGLATITGNFQVFFLAAFGLVVLGERFTWRFAVSVPIAVSGLLLLVGIDWDGLEAGYRRGIYFGLLTALTYAAYILILKSSQSREPRLSPVSNLAVISVAGALIMGIEGYAQGESFRLTDGMSWASMGAYGLVCHAGGWILISRALTGVEASRAGLILLLQPTLAFVWDIVFFERPAGSADLGGAALTLLAIYLGSSRSRPGTRARER